MANEKSLYGKITKVIDKAEDVCLVSMFALMVFFIFLQIIMRFIVNHSLVWSEELGKFIFVWISWLGISIGERRNEHIKITLLVDKLSPKWQKIFEIIAYIILAAIILVTLYYAVVMVQFQVRVRYAGIKISTSWGYLSLVLGCSFMLLRLVAVIIRDLTALITKNYTASSHPHMVDQIAAAVDAFEQEGGTD